MGELKVYRLCTIDCDAHRLNITVNAAPDIFYSASFDVFLRRRTGHGAGKSSRFDVSPIPDTSLPGEERLEVLRSTLQGYIAQAHRSVHGSSRASVERLYRTADEAARAIAADSFFRLR